MTAPLPTLAEIDDLLHRSVLAEGLALSEVVEFIAQAADRWNDVVEMRRKRDAMLECRTRVASLEPRPA